MYKIVQKDQQMHLDVLIWLYYIAVTDVFQSSMWPLLERWEKGYKYTYNVSKSFHI